MDDVTATSPPKVSVIIPAYNQAFYLADAIQSVLIQTFHDYEIVVVNDGSTDDTASIAKQYSESIHYIYQENQGLAGARNTGIRAAKGELIALLDSDDIWESNFLEKMVALVDANLQTAVFYCAARCIDEERHLLEQIVGYQHIKSANFYASLLRSNFIIPSTTVMRKSVIIQARLFDQTFRSCEDWDLWLRLLSTGHDFVGSPEVLVHYRIHSNSLSSDVSKMQFSQRAVVEKHFGEDDQQYEHWGKRKQLAFGGLYRYQLLTNIQRQNNWTRGEELFCKAVLSDPTICSDIDFYYELALGSQPVGFRGTTDQLNLVENGKNIEKMLANLFLTKEHCQILTQRKIIEGTAYKAVGLAAYNTGHLGLCRKYLYKALMHQPSLLREIWIVMTFLKSLLGNHVLSFIRYSRAKSIQEAEE